MSSTKETRVHAFFVVIRTDSLWHYGVDLVVKGPTGEQIYNFRDKINEKFNFVARHKGVHRFCFTNKYPYHETLDFDVHVGHFAYYFEHSKDEHFSPLLQQIEKLKDAHSKIQFGQHWLNAQTHRQAGVKKAVFESGSLILASVFQVYLLHRLFGRKVIDPGFKSSF